MAFPLTGIVRVRGRAQLQSETLDDNTDCDARAGIVPVVHVIAVVLVVDVNVVGVIPAGWPRFNKSKPIAAVLEAGISADHFRFAHAKYVLTAKVGAKTIIWNAAAASLAEPDCGL